MISVTILTKTTQESGPKTGTPYTLTRYVYQLRFEGKVWESFTTATAAYITLRSYEKVGAEILQDEGYSTLMSHYFRRENPEAITNEPIPTPPVDDRGFIKNSGAE